MAARGAQKGGVRADDSILLRRAPSWAAVVAAAAAGAAAAFDSATAESGSGREERWSRPGPRAEEPEFARRSGPNPRRGSPVPSVGAGSQLPRVTVAERS